MLILVGRNNSGIHPLFVGFLRAFNLVDYTMFLQ